MFGWILVRSRLEPWQGADERAVYLQSDRISAFLFPHRRDHLSQDLHIPYLPFSSFTMVFPPASDLRYMVADCTPAVNGTDLVSSEDGIASSPDTITEGGTTVRHHEEKEEGTTANEPAAIVSFVPTLSGYGKQRSLLVPEEEPVPSTDSPSGIQRSEAAGERRRHSLLNGRAGRGGVVGPDGELPAWRIKKRRPRPGCSYPLVIIVARLKAMVFRHRRRAQNEERAKEEEEKGDKKTRRKSVEKRGEEGGLRRRSSAVLCTQQIEEGGGEGEAGTEEREEGRRGREGFWTSVSMDGGGLGREEYGSSSGGEDEGGHGTTQGVRRQLSV